MSFPRFLALVGLALAASCVRVPGDKVQAPGLEGPSLSGCVPAERARTDAATGLPTRIVHEASGIVLVLIPAGEFRMGSPEDEAGRTGHERQHRRVIRAPFYLGETEVTVAQFARFVNATGYRTDAERGTEESGHGRGAFAATPDGDREWTATASWRNPFPNLPDHRPRDDHPVVHVSWNDAQQFAAHFGLRLPSEAQWEYAARAGSRERFRSSEAEKPAGLPRPLEGLILPSWLQARSRQVHLGSVPRSREQVALRCSPSANRPSTTSASLIASRDCKLSQPRWPEPVR
jgi:formylglycine-generating enzyme required for sulfatase activity